MSIPVQAAKKAVDTVIEYSAKINPALQLTRVMPSGRSKVQNEIIFAIYTFE